MACCVVWLTGLASVAASQESAPVVGGGSAPTAVAPAPGHGGFVSLINRAHPGNRIGYRFHEHVPFVAGPTPSKGDDTVRAAAERLEAEFKNRPRVFVHEQKVSEEGWCPQEWTFYIAPAVDGFDLLWVVGTHEAPLNEYYAAQQCFRMGGVTNEAWRREIAETPAFSEYDAWAHEAEKGEKPSSLSYVVQNGRWAAMPATRNHVAYRTDLGIAMDTLRTGGRIETADLKPYGPTTFEGRADSGLAARASVAGDWVCGLYWERTTHVADHHPADCLHAIVNLGPIPAEGKRALRGKIYWMKGTLDDLLQTWTRDFPEGR